MKYTDKDLYWNIKQVEFCKDLDLIRNITGGKMRRSDLANKVASIAKEQNFPAHHAKTILDYV